ncbi:glutamine amidotransferase [Maritimibacter sp. 55A14]|uniref:type 1 glutamine amidotransferase n=1 Tax=Maritimibacter sp. 55A14 TaxID=2174844 RepID=UPI000D6091CF|nr:type 1 glutamine amidotransferase [Maritimibacter sp. 55A14]PWE32030.1 glutamine amidotransferase [Maritimibacter sp. 55A14]
MKIGILQTGYAPAELAEAHGEYPDMFERLLAGHGFTFENWPVLDNVFPEDIRAAEGWLITGSKYGTYEELPWIAPLEAFIREAYAAQVPLAGICFGHQIIAQALGGKVEKYHGGWSVGRQSYEVSGQGARAYNAWHQDQVTALPEDAQVIARSDFCQNAATVYGDRVFSVQWHPEFDDAFIEGLIRTRGKGVVPEPLLEQARQEIGKPIASDETGEQIAAFFKRARAKQGSR